MRGNCDCPWWLKFSAAGESSIAEKTDSTREVESMPQSAPGIEDLFKDSPSPATPPVSAQPQKDVKNDIMSLFEKVYAAIFCLSDLLPIATAYCLSCLSEP